MFYICNLLCITYTHKYVRVMVNTKTKRIWEKKHASILRVGSYHITVKGNRKKINDLSLGNFNKMLSKNVGNGWKLLQMS